jgi:hypothetical protein
MITPKLTGHNYRIGCSVRSSDYSRGIRKIAAHGSRGGETTPRCFRLTFTFVDQERPELRDRRLGLRNMYRVVGPKHLQLARTSLLNLQARLKRTPAAASPGTAERWSSAAAAYLPWFPSLHS